MLKLYKSLMILRPWITRLSSTFSTVCMIPLLSTDKEMMLGLSTDPPSFTIQRNNESLQNLLLQRLNPSSRLLLLPLKKLGSGLMLKIIIKIISQRTHMAMNVRLISSDHGIRSRSSTPVLSNVLYASCMAFNVLNVINHQTSVNLSTYGALIIIKPFVPLSPCPLSLHRHFFFLSISLFFNRIKKAGQGIP